jgi:hypothetical protein
MMNEADRISYKLLKNKDWQNPSSLEELGYIFFGPLMFNFLNWLKSESNTKGILLFNSREGLFLQELYKIFKDKYNLNDSVYFKTSRRLSSLSSFNNINDITESFKFHKYIGTMSTLLHDRFGLSNINDDSPVDTHKKIPDLKYYVNDILLNAARLKADYGSYVNNVIKDHSHIYMVDCGYQGSTQYFLEKTYNLNIKGKYITHKETPRLKDAKGYLDFNKSKFKNNIIFFESVFTDSVGTYIDITDGNFINEVPTLNQYFFEEKKIIVHGIKSFIIDMLSYDTEYTCISQETPDRIFNLMCTNNYVKKSKLFDTFFHDNLYSRNFVKKIKIL